MPRTTFSVGHKLALAFLVAALVPAGTALVVFHWRSEDVRMEEVHAHQLDLARVQEELLARHVRSIERHAEMLAETQPVRDHLDGLSKGGDVDAVGETAEDLVRAAQARLWGTTHHVYLTDASGASLFRTKERDQDHHLVTHPVYGAGGDVVGAVAWEVALDTIDELLGAEIQLGGIGRVTLARTSGEGSVHPPTEGAEPPESPGLREAIRTGEPTSGLFEDASGRRVLGTYVPSRDHPWVVCIEIERDEALAGVLETRALLGKVLAAIAAVLALAGIAIGAWFGAPLRRCAAAASRVSDGDLKSPIPVTRGADEIGVLERATEAMRVGLLEQIETLDERVVRQTVELEQVLSDSREAEERYMRAVQGSRDGLWDWDLETDRIYFAPRWKELVGASEDEVGDTPDEWYARIPSERLPDFQARLDEHVHGTAEVLDMELEMLHADGGLRWMLCRAAAVRDDDGRAIRLAGSLADITELKRAQDDLLRLEYHDQLTGLPNRRLFTERLDRAIAASLRDPERTYAVLFFDFDRFKVVNDSLGHEVGDALLVGIANRFRQTLRACDTVARFGGDEFVVLLEGIKEERQAIDGCRRILLSFEEPHDLSGNQVVLTASAGVVIGNASYRGSEAVLRDADAAMYGAKSAGHAQFRVFDQAMHTAARHRLDLENDLRSADFDRELRLLYQPIVSVATGDVAGFEALVRWEHPVHGTVSPDAFIPIAEETGLIVDLGEWVLREACGQLAEWKKVFGTCRELFMNVNVSRRQLVDPGFVSIVEAVVREHGITPGELELEITETAVMDTGVDLVPVMREIREHGVRLAMDDFGTGQSSLSCLHRFPIDVLKIDRSFLENLEESQEFTTVIQTIITLAHHLSLEVVAEGIEAPEQLAQLQATDCEYAQGFLFSYPLKAEDASELIRHGFGRRMSA